jgi:hypothetical protein
MSNGTPSQSALENDISALRDRLAQTIDELTVRAAPQNVVNRQKEQAKASFYSATHTDTGEVRMDRAAIAAAVVIGLVALKVISKRRSRRW